MRKFLLVLALVLSVVLPLGSIEAPQRGSHRSSTSSHSKTVHVREYTRKDGTVVHSHYRSAPGTATPYTRNGGLSVRAAGQSGSGHRALHTDGPQRHRRDWRAGGRPAGTRVSPFCRRR
jgi:hypothetical protein